MSVYSLQYILRLSVVGNLFLGVSDEIAAALTTLHAVGLRECS